MALRLFLFGAIAPFAGALMVSIRSDPYHQYFWPPSSFLGVLLAAMMTQKWQLWLSVVSSLALLPE